MLLQMGLLLRLGPNVITDGTLITLGSSYYTCAFNSVLSNYLGMMRTVLLNCPIKTEIRTVDSQSDLRILL